MPHVDFGSEPAYHYMSTIRAAERQGALDRIPRRPAADPIERDYAAQIGRELTRSYHGRAGPRDPSDSPAPVAGCCRCGATDTELRLWRSVWERDATVSHYYVCRGGCPAAGG